MFRRAAISSNSTAPARCDFVIVAASAQRRARLRECRSRTRALALPFVVFTQDRLVLLDLRLQFAEGLLATGANVFARSGGVECSGRQRQIQRERSFFAMRII